MNKRDRDAKFKVTKIHRAGPNEKWGARDTFFAFGWQIEDHARLRQVLKSGQPYTLRSNASLRTCVKVIADFSDLEAIVISRRFKHVGIHEKYAKPICVRGKGVTS